MLSLRDLGSRLDAESDAKRVTGPADANVEPKPLELKLQAQDCSISLEPFHGKPKDALALAPDGRVYLKKYISRCNVSPFDSSIKILPDKLKQPPLVFFHLLEDVSVAKKAAEDLHKRNITLEHELKDAKEEITSLEHKTKRLKRKLDDSAEAVAEHTYKKERSEETQGRSREMVIPLSSSEMLKLCLHPRNAKITIRHYTIAPSGMLTLSSRNSIQVHDLDMSRDILLLGDKNSLVAYSTKAQHICLLSIKNSNFIIVDLKMKIDYMLVNPTGVLGIISDNLMHSFSGKEILEFYRNSTAYLGSSHATLYAHTKSRPDVASTATVTVSSDAATRVVVR